MAQTGESVPVVVARSDDIPERGRTVVEVAGQEIGVFRFKGKLFAYSNYCAHAGGPVCQGMLIGRVIELLGPDKQTLGDRISDTELHIVCPWHGYEYDVETGAHPIDSSIRLRPYPVYERDGQVTVEL